jgi:hypothetical protein
MKTPSDSAETIEGLDGQQFQACCSHEILEVGLVESSDMTC